MDFVTTIKSILNVYEAFAGSKLMLECTCIVIINK